MSRSPSPRGGGGDTYHQVYIGFLPNHATMKDVESFFEGYGKVKSINLKPGYGFAVFEDRRDAEDAVKNLDGTKMCGERVDIQHAKGPGHKAKKRQDRSRSNERGGPRINDNRRDRYEKSSYSRRSRSRTPPRRRSPPRSYSPPRNAYTLRVTNLSTRCSWQDLKDWIRKETKVEAAFCSAHKEVTREGIVAFNRIYELETVQKELQGEEINGKAVHFERIDKIKDGPRYSHSRSRSRSPRRRSRSRSRSYSR